MWNLTAERQHVNIDANSPSRLGAVVEAKNIPRTIAIVASTNHIRESTVIVDFCLMRRMASRGNRLEGHEAVPRTSQFVGLPGSFFKLSGVVSCRLLSFMSL